MSEQDPPRSATPVEGALEDPSASADTAATARLSATPVEGALAPAGQIRYEPPGGDSRIRYTTDQILVYEAYKLGLRWIAPGTAGDALNRELNQLNTSALCLSGGGIRSAAFALGLIQALATHPRPIAHGSQHVGSATQSLLAKFHYLSTVSGGGYIGSWLSAWRRERPFAEIWASLVARASPNTEAAPIAWLRSYSNYLTPSVGLMSADTWSAAATWTRNLFLNWLLILSPLCALILGVKILGLASTWAIQWDDFSAEWPQWLATLDWTNGSTFFLRLGLQFAAAPLAAVALVIAIAFTTRGRPGCKMNPTDGPDQPQYLWRTLFWSVVSAFLLTHFFASDLVGLSLLDCKGIPVTLAGWFSICRDHSDPNTYWLTARHGVLATMAFGTVPGALVYAIGWLIGSPRRDRLSWLDLLAWTISGAVYGALAAAVLYLYLITPDQGLKDGKLTIPLYPLHLVLGIPLILICQIVSEMIFVGLGSYEREADPDREWFGRSAGWLFAAAIGWFVGTFLVFFGAVLVAFGFDPATAVPKMQQYASVIAAVTGLFTAVFSKSSLIPVEGPTKGVSSYVISLILPVAAVLFVIALVVILSTGLDQALFHARLIPDRIQDLDWFGRLKALVWALIAALILLLGASPFVNINWFSLHALYRNRLTRAFLGASRSESRRPDPFTEFDPKDNPQMASFWYRPAHGAPATDPNGWRPLHVINIALNIVSSKANLAWQERKAAAFTVTPFHSGSSLVGYRSTATYGGRITLGTAMAISGAAASPNMGYHSSPAVTFLMTMFNVRLGWWLGNPGDKGERTFDKLGPTYAIQPLIQEAFGLTTADKKYVYLSDGGHFENLGLYEMVRRRCRFILMSDAGCDPEYKFADLADAVRKISIDLGVPIRFRGLEDLKPRVLDQPDIGQGQPYHAIGEIDYQTADGPDSRNGIIVYVKAGYHGCESAGVRGYAKANPDFPHQTTTDQWFTESQFESYRALGFEIMDGILNAAFADASYATNRNLENLFVALKEVSQKTPYCALCG